MSKSILIVLTGALGDVARGMALVHPLRSAGYRVSWLVDSRWAPVVQLHPELDQVIPFDRARGLRGLFEAGAAARNAQFDIVFDLQRIAKSGLLSFFSRAPRRIGFHRRDAKELNWLWNTERIGYFGEELPKLAQYFRFFDSINLPIPSYLRYGLEDLSATELLGELAPHFTGRPLALLLGSAWRTKDWPAAGYHHLIGVLLRETSAPIVLLGDRARGSLGTELVQAAQSPRVTSLAGVTSLTQLVGAVKASRVLVGPDSGPAHLAAAVGTPTVSLFGPTSALRTAPAAGIEVLCRSEEEIKRYKALLSERVVTSPIGCSPCYRRVCPGLDTLCMRTISVHAVARQVLARIL